MTGHKLTAEQTELLIELVKDNPGIWNTSDPTYNDRSATATAWTNIAKQMQLPEELIRVKWKNLRDLFARQLKRLYGTEVEDYMGRWKHFKRLWFLYRSSKDQLASEDESEIDPKSIHEQHKVKIEICSDAENGFMDQESYNSKRRISTDSINDPIDVSEGLLSDERPLKKPRHIESDDFDLMFLKSLTPYFKMLKPMRKLVVRTKIQELLYKEISKGTMNGQLTDNQ